VDAAKIEWWSSDAQVVEGFLNVSKKEVKFLMIKTIHSTERFDPYSPLVLGGKRAVIFRWCVCLSDLFTGVFLTYVVMHWVNGKSFSCYLLNFYKAVVLFLFFLWACHDEVGFFSV
jgi:hypothetical protein